MKYAIIMACAVNIALVSLLGHAQVRTTTQILESCEKYEPARVTYESGYCLGFLEGATDAHQRMMMSFALAKVRREEEPIYGRNYCFPGQYTLEDLRVIFIQYAKNNPAEIHFPAERLLGNALAQVYSCPPRFLRW